MTEKDYAPRKEKTKKMVVENPKKVVDRAPISENKKAEVKKETVDTKENKEVEKKAEEKEVKKIEVKKEKKTEAVINDLSIPISTKKAMAICKFIKWKKIDDAISDLKEVVMLKKAVPMKGEIPHRKGKGMMSGRFPKKTAEYFIKALKRLSANSSVNGLENPIIVTAIANMGPRPFGSFGSVRRKRTHVQIIAKEKVKKDKKKNGNK